MRVLEHDELNSELQADLQHLRASISLPPRDFGRLKRAVKEGYPAADYFGLYAVEGKHVLSSVRVLRVPYTFADGHVEKVSAIGSVMTRLDSRGRGLVRGLLGDVHARERGAGISYSTLWCEPSIKAHGLYEFLGYKDVYHPDFATGKRSGGKTGRGAYEFAKVLDADVEEMERIHTLATRRRIGFTPRPKGYLRSLFWYGRFSPESFRMIVKGGRPVGYLQLDQGAVATQVSEVVLLPEGAQALKVVSMLERLAGDSWLWLNGTFVSDNERPLQRRGYLVSNLNNHVWMVLPLKKSNRKDLVKVFGLDDPRFSYHTVDFF
ncbi:MAG: GNAT family N-acetyltransferase [Thaumarchaeota archaeon]|nr:GNAT family N-acetyltransferase [Nitrososphaerota archaeon]